MKSLILILTVLISTNLMAQQPASEADKKVYLQNLAKELRKEMWEFGHKDVESVIEFFDKAKLDEYVKSENNRSYETPLEDYEIGNLYRCYYEENCEIHVIFLNGTYMGGYGVTARFILLHKEELYHESIGHTVYAE